MNLLLKNIKGFRVICKCSFVFWIYLVTACGGSIEQYYGTPTSEIRNDSLYQVMYNKFRSQMPGDTTDLNYAFFANNGEGSTSSIILASKYKFRFPTFSCIKENNWKAIELASDDAIIDYFKEEYGETFWEELNKEATFIDKTFKTHHFDSFIPNMLKKNYTLFYNDDSVQLGILNTQSISEYPFLIQLDTAYNSTYFDYSYSVHQMKFKALKEDYFNKNVRPLPTIKIKIFWDKSRIDFPYSEYPLTTIYLESEYQ